MELMENSSDANALSKVATLPVLPQGHKDGDAEEFEHDGDTEEFEHGCITKRVLNYLASRVNSKPKPDPVRVLIVSRNSPTTPTSILVQQNHILLIVLSFSVKIHLSLYSSTKKSVTKMTFLI